MKDAVFFTRAFVVSLIVFFVIVAAVLYHSAQNTPESQIKHRLTQLYYPTRGYYYADGTVKYPDGRMAVIQSDKVEVYPVNIYQATSAAYSVLSPYNSKLVAYNYSLALDYEHFTETVSNSTPYFVFPVYLNRQGHNDRMTVGFVFVDRKSGGAFIKGLFG